MVLTVTAVVCISYVLLGVPNDIANHDPSFHNQNAGPVSVANGNCVLINSNNGTTSPCPPNPPGMPPLGQPIHYVTVVTSVTAVVPNGNCVLINSNNGTTSPCPPNPPGTVPLGA